MKKAKHSRMGKRLITAMKEVVAHVEGKVALPVRYTYLTVIEQNPKSVAAALTSK